MRELLKNAKDFKIIPNNFKSSGELLVEDIKDDVIKARLILVDEAELEDYKPDENVEIFGVNETGLIYFETKIVSIQDDNIYLKTTTDYSVIQRREYSRVKLEHGQITFEDMPENFVANIQDISAGGIKLITEEELNTDIEYSIQLRLSGNMRIECQLKPIRVEKIENNKYEISGKFLNIENIDRIVLVQYVFKKKMENQDIKTRENE